MLGFNGAWENTFFFQKMNRNKNSFFFSLRKIFTIIIIHDKNAV